jgi:hypothetical protein
LKQRDAYWTGTFTEIIAEWHIVGFALMRASEIHIPRLTGRPPMARKEIEVECVIKRNAIADKIHDSFNFLLLQETDSPRVRIIAGKLNGDIIKGLKSLMPPGGSRNITLVIKS